MENKRYDGLFRLCKDSYSLWPENAALPASEVAEAGFVYERVQDYVRCPVCRIRLFDWMPTSDPLHEHERFSKGKCKFLDYIKTREAEAPCTTNDWEDVPLETIKSLEISEKGTQELSSCIQCTDTEPITSRTRQKSPKNKNLEKHQIERLISDYIQRPELQILLKHGADKESLKEEISERVRKGRDILNDIDSIMFKVMSVKS